MIIYDLIKLSKIFPTGFTVKLNNGILSQYCDNNRYIVSYLTVIEIKNGDKPVFKNIQHIPKKCIIGGWADIDNNTYLIELNKTFKYLKSAVKFGKAWSQRYVYDIETGGCVKI